MHGNGHDQHSSASALAAPGTGNPDRLAENVAAGAVRLTDEEPARMDALHTRPVTTAPRDESWA
ncbi:hypothetical protein AB0958_28600 [Streptomyces sp. NPDC006655]|uniref:hypothetical protein n=1 Tax=Streptomyces sp. NPDC006655 TaxID=3156898 RepID=UPI003454383B